LLLLLRSLVKMVVGLLAVMLLLDAWLLLLLRRLVRVVEGLLEAVMLLLPLRACVGVWGGGGDEGGRERGRER